LKISTGYSLETMKNKRC